MMWWYGPPGWGMMLWMGLGALFWFALLGFLIWLLVRWFTRDATRTMRFSPPMPSSSPSALEILKQRYARGEIDTSTFEAMRERLQATQERDERLQPV